MSWPHDEPVPAISTAIFCDLDLDGGCTHDARHSGEFLMRLALCRQSRERGRDLDRADVADVGQNAKELDALLC